VSIDDRQALLDRATRAMNEVGALAWMNLADEECERIESLVTGAIYNLLQERETLLACESNLRALVGFLRPDNRYALHAREALERLDLIREEVAR
jgi:hypothetical protein